MHNWPIWFVTVILVVAAVIDGKMLKVPNWLTFPFIIAGLAYCTITWGWPGLGWSLVGMVVGLVCLLPLYAIGGMGAGDVKLLAGVGTWIGADATWWAFCWTAVVGGVIAIGMVIYRRSWRHHQAQLMGILGEIATIRNPEALASIAAQRKSSMLLLPFGIPIAIGTIAYFAYAGMF